MKMRILWALSVVWALLFCKVATGRIGHAWQAEGSIFNMGEKLEAFLAGVGAFTVGVVPLALTYLLHRFHKSRERGRLEKERARIDKRIDKIDRKSGVLTPTPPPEATTTDPATKSSSVAAEV